MLDFWDRSPRLYTFDRGRPPSTACYGCRRPNARLYSQVRMCYGRSENAT